MFVGGCGWTVGGTGWMDGICLGIFLKTCHRCLCHNSPLALLEGDFFAAWERNHSPKWLNAGLIWHARHLDRIPMYKGCTIRTRGWSILDIRAIGKSGWSRLWHKKYHNIQGYRCQNNVEWKRYTTYLWPLAWSIYSSFHNVFIL